MLMSRLINLIHSSTQQDPIPYFNLSKDDIIMLVSLKLFFYGYNWGVAPFGHKPTIHIPSWVFLKKTSN
jgi:hypothetical protein